MRSLRALPSAPDLDLMTYLRQHPRAFTRRELVALSSPGRVRALVTQRQVVRLLPNFYVAAEHQHSFHARVDAAMSWAGEDALLAGRSALFVMGLLHAPPAVIEVLVPHGRSASTPQWLKTRQYTYDAKAVQVEGYRTVGVPFAIVQGYGDLTETEQSDVVFRGIAKKRTSTKELRQALAVVPRVRKRRALTSRICAVEQGAESWLEEKGLRDVFSGRHFDHIVRQHEVVHEGRQYRLDMFDPFTRTCVELDSYTWHSSDEQRLRDIRRDADLASIGILTVRLSSRDLKESPDWCQRIVLEIFASRKRPA